MFTVFISNCILCVTVGSTACLNIFWQCHEKERAIRIYLITIVVIMPPSREPKWNFVKMTFQGYFSFVDCIKWVLFIIPGSWVEQDCGPSKITFLTVVTISCTSHLPPSSPCTFYILYTGILYIHTLLTPFAYYRVIFMGNKKLMYSIS